MQQLQFDCYCLSKTNQDAFNCVICNKMHHNKCYNINFMERIPANMKCITCRISQYEPFYSIKENLYSKQYFILNIESYNKREIHFDIKSKYNDFKHNPNWEVVIICTPIKPTVKKAVNDPSEQHLKKNKFAPQYEWPSQNIFIEWNHMHIKYSQNSFAVVPRDSVKTHNILQFTVNDIKHQSFMTAFMVDKRKPQDLIDRLQIRLENDSRIPSQIRQYYKETIDKTILAAANDDQVMLQSPYLTINLTDPLTFEQLDIPVKGMRCQHTDCFDLSRFIESNTQPKENRWKCPKCLEYLDFDHLIIDLVQYQILHDLKSRYPKQCEQISKAYIIDTNLNYKLDQPFDFDKIFNQANSQNNACVQPIQKLVLFQVKLQKIRRLLPLLQEFFDLLFDPFLEEVQLTREEISRLFLALKQTTSFFEDITEEEDAIIVFRIIFDCDDFFNQYLFVEARNYTNSSNIEQLSKSLYYHTLGGVFGEYCCHIAPQVHNLNNYIVSFSLLFQEQQFHKYFELCLGISYAIKLRRDDFMKYQTKSFGYILGYFMEMYHVRFIQAGASDPKMEVLDVQHEKIIKFVNLYLTDLLNPKFNNQSSLFTASEFLIQLFQIKKNHDIVINFLRLYDADAKDRDKITISILIYYILVNIKKERNKQDNGPSYYIDSTIWIQIEKSFYEILDQLSQNKVDLRSAIKKQGLEFKDYKIACNILEYEFSCEKIQTILI